MKKPKHELMTFVAGIVMLVAGLFILSQKVIVSSSFFSSFGGLSIWGARVSSGMVVIPLIIGIVWMFMTDSFASKVFSALAGLLILVLIFGGLGFVGRVLLADRKNDEVDPREEMYREMYGESTDKKLKRRK